MGRRLANPHDHSGTSRFKWTRDAKGTRANLLESWQWNADATQLTANWRKGVRWSDGQPLTVDDYLFWWNDMVGDQRVKMTEPLDTRTKGQLMKVEKVDDYTLKFTFPGGSNPLFLEYQSRGCYSASQYIVPAHYMKQFHPTYNKSVKDTEVQALLDQYNNRPQLSDMPTYAAWKTITFSSGQRVVMDRNPYFWKVDERGMQLPYIDAIDTQVIPDDQVLVMKAAAGELDCQFREFWVTSLSVLQEGASKNDYRVILWDYGDFGAPVFILGYDYPDAGIVDLLYDKRFRQAISWAINRKRVVDIVALGFAKARNAALAAGAPEFQTPEGKKVYEDWVNSYAAYEPNTAKKLLDEIGVVDKNGDGVRERPDGTALESIIDCDVSQKHAIDTADFVKQDWEAIGLKTTLNVIDGTLLGQRAMDGQYMFWARPSAAWGLISASTHWVPIQNVSYGIAPRIGLYYQTAGREGVPPRPGSMLEKLQNAYTELITIVDPKERERKLLDAYRIHIDEGPINLGVVGEYKQPIVVKNNFRNVTDYGVSGPWDLGYPGTIDPEQFYFKK